MNVTITKAHARLRLTDELVVLIFLLFFFSLQIQNIPNFLSISIKINKQKKYQKNNKQTQIA